MSTVLDDYLNTKEAAELIGCTDGNVRQMLLDGRMKGKKLGPRAWAIPRREAVRVKNNPSAMGRPRSGTTG